MTDQQRIAEIEALEALRNMHINDTHNGTRLSVVLTHAAVAIHEQAAKDTEIERLKAQLTASERRERAAVEDLTEMANRAGMEDLCVFCRWWTSGGCGILNPDNPNACFEWRGPQETGSQEGEAE